ncbi:signal transduction protein [Candidatus Magnetoovum chiemensis]|nr:signal transduction protein [Candidatus Magnetoovum chiemensis]
MQMRMLEKGEFPAMSQTILTISKQTAPDSDASITELTNSILNDYALANKILKMVNSVFYIKHQIDGKISTVSRAVYILGFSHVRNAALSLMLFDNLKDHAMTVDLKDNLIISFMSGAIARAVSRKIGFKEVEESFICALFHNLGKLLTIFYLPEDLLKIRELMSKKKMTEDEAVALIFDTTYEDIGMNVAKTWNFSDDIINSMNKLTEPPSAPLTKLDKLRYLSCFADQLCSLVNTADKDPQAWNENIKNLSEKFSAFFVLKVDEVKEILNNAFTEVIEYSKSFNFKIEEIPFLLKLNAALGGDFMFDAAGMQKSAALAESFTYEDRGGISILDISSSEYDSLNEDNPEAIMTKGIQEIANTLLEDYSLNDILRMILEVLYRGMKFNRVLICIKRTREPLMEARFGFGKDINKISKGFKFQIEKEAEDVFNDALINETDILINDINDSRLRRRIPMWYRNLVEAETFVLIPITVMKIPIGIIYADKTKAHQISVTTQQLMFFKTLRNQAVLAIKQRM